MEIVEKKEIVEKLHSKQKQTVEKKRVENKIVKNIYIYWKKKTQKEEKKQIVRKKIEILMKSYRGSKKKHIVERNRQWEKKPKKIVKKYR